eukprot:scaffold336_cov196-Amphora_coffeaeformis.AAC.19
MNLHAWYTLHHLHRNIRSSTDRRRVWPETGVPTTSLPRCYRPPRHRHHPNLLRCCGGGGGSRCGGCCFCCCFTAWRRHRRCIIILIIIIGPSLVDRLGKAGRTTLFLLFALGGSFLAVGRRLQQRRAATATTTSTADDSKRFCWHQGQQKGVTTGQCRHHY